MTLSTRASVAAAAAIALTFGLTGCGSDSLDGSSGTSSAADSGSVASQSADSKLEAMVPADIKKKGTLTIGSDASYKPNEFMPVGSKTITGMDVDLFNAIAARLGMKTEWQNADFSTIIPGMGTKFDVGVSSFTINSKRLKEVTMVSYLTAGTQWAVQNGNPKKIDPKNPCGQVVGVQNGTTQLDELNALNKGQCKSKPVKIVPETDQTKVNLDLTSGKVDAMTADSPITQYAVKESKGLELVGEVTDSAPYGIVLAKNQTKFGDAIVAALKAMKADGSYESILKKWGQTANFDDFAVNPDVSN